MSDKNAIVKVKSNIEYNSVQFTGDNADFLDGIGVPIYPSRLNPGSYTLFEKIHDDSVFLDKWDWIVWDPDYEAFEAWGEAAYNKHFVRA